MSLCQVLLDVILLFFRLFLLDSLNLVHNRIHVSHKGNGRCCDHISPSLALMAVSILSLMSSSLYGCICTSTSIISEAVSRVAFTEPKVETRKFTRRRMNSPTVSFRFSTFKWVDITHSRKTHQKRHFRFLSGSQKRSWAIDQSVNLAQHDFHTVLFSKPPILEALLDNLKICRKIKTLSRDKRILPPYKSHPYWVCSYQELSSHLP